MGSRRQEGGCWEAAVGLGSRSPEHPPPRPRPLLLETELELHSWAPTHCLWNILIFPWLC